MQVCIIAVIAASLALQDARAIVVTAPVWTCWLGIVVAPSAVLLSSLFVLRQTLADLRVGTKQQAEKRLSTRFLLHRIVWLVASLLVLTCFRWPEFVSAVSPTRLVSRPLVLLPVLLPLLGSWAILFSLESELDPATRQLGRWRFVLRRARQFVLLPLFAILLVVGWQDVVASLSPLFPNELSLAFVRILPLFAMMFFFPAMLRRMWQTRSLDAGALRERLELHGERLGLRSRDILVWETGRTVRNAAVAGIVDRWRYIFLSDGLLNDLSTKHVECVFLHEMGHIKNRHPLRLLVAALAVFALGMATISVTWASPHALAVVKIAAVAGMCAGILLFGRLAQLFELQADLWAASHSEGSHVEYLRAIASIAGDDPDARTWLHPSFQRRCEFILAGAETGKRWLRKQLWQSLFFVGVLLIWYGFLAGIACSG